MKLFINNIYNSIVKVTGKGKHFLHEPLFDKNENKFVLLIKFENLILKSNIEFSRILEFYEINLDRRLINKKSYGSAKGIWISTNRDGIWALQLRSMIPVSGTISSLAGTNMNCS